MTTLGNHKLLFRKGPRELTRAGAILAGFEKKAAEVKKAPWGKAKTYSGLGLAALGLTAYAAHKTYKAVDKKIGVDTPKNEW